MGGKLAVLMYHAIIDDGGQCVDADPHYAVRRPQFLRHLQALRDAGLRGSSVQALVQSGAAVSDTVGLTFDDGHASNRWAAERLAEHGFSADFFVNPSTVGQAHYLCWADLRAMAQAGMSIQSHGQHHRYLDELAPEEVKAELADSKREIEDRLGRPVEVFAPPGGRTAAALAATATTIGYRALCTSRVGLWRLQQGAWDIPRFAVLQSTSDQRLARWIHQDWQEITTQRTRHALLSSAKRLLGNRGYERLRQGLLRAARP
jgi:peptidoglycan/xylan/chitin deacetylase (PgdA/CDA1 family)